MTSFLIELSGTVIRGKNRGKRLGFPTANIALEADVGDGVYLGYTSVDDKKMPSLLFIGAAETFGEKDRFAESHILNFAGGLYGKKIRIELKEKLREPKKFASSEALVVQMNNDLEKAREYFKLKKIDER